MGYLYYQSDTRQLFHVVIVTVHDGGSHFLEAGMPALVELEAMAECGDLTGLLTTYPADADTIVNPAAGMLRHGATTTAMLDTDPLWGVSSCLRLWSADWFCIYRDDSIVIRRN